MTTIWGLGCQEHVSQAVISNFILQFTVGCNYLSLPEIPASGAKVLIYTIPVADQSCCCYCNVCVLCVRP